MSIEAAFLVQEIAVKPDRAVHEAGHTLAAYVVGREVHLVQLGPPSFMRCSSLETDTEYQDEMQIHLAGGIAEAVARGDAGGDVDSDWFARVFHEGCLKDWNESDKLAFKLAHGDFEVANDFSKSAIHHCRRFMMEDGVRSAVAEIANALVAQSQLCESEIIAIISKWSVRRKISGHHSIQTQMLRPTSPQQGTAAQRPSANER